LHGTLLVDDFALAVEAYRSGQARLGLPVPDSDRERSRVAMTSTTTFLSSLVRLADSRGRPLAVFSITRQLNRLDPPVVRRVYTKDELTALAPLIAEVRAVWQRRCEEYIASGRTCGSSVMGAGVAINYLYPRARRPQQAIVLSPPSQTDGSLSWETSVAEILELLRSKGVDCHYHQGRLD
jgi:hypothetical protein